MPIDPMISNGLRPHRSIEAMRVVRMLIVAPITMITKAWLSLNPTASHSTLE